MILQVYCPAWDGAMLLSVRTFDIVKFGIIPGPCHSNPPILVDRVVKQVRVTVSPAVMWEGVTEMMTACGMCFF